MKKNSIHQFLNNKGLLLIILLALIVRMGFFFSLKPWNKEVVDKSVIVGDAIGYHQLAVSLLSKSSFEDFDALRTPGYPVFVALIYGISSNSVWVVLLVQILLSVVSVVLVYKLAAMIFSNDVALISSFLAAIDTTQSYWSVSLYSDILFVFLLLASIYYLCKSLQVKSYLLLCLSAIFLGIATLVRPILFLFPVATILMILMVRNFKPKMKLAYSLFYCIIFIAVISPWLLHNYTKYGEAKLSSISGYNLYWYNAAYTEVYKTGKTVEEVRKSFNDQAIKQGIDTTNIFTFKSSQIYSDLGKQYIKNNFMLYCKRHFMGIVNMYAGLGTQKIAEVFHFRSNALNVEPFGDPGILKRMINFFQSRTKEVIFVALGLVIYLFVNYLFSVYGIFVSLREKERFWLLFVLIILYFTALTGVVGYDRYRIPIMPFINILCGVGLTHFYNKLTDKLKNGRSKVVR